ncbi:MAG: hypothetical protein AAFR76_06660 [Planctomycetota bacterium]
MNNLRDLPQLPPLRPPDLRFGPARSDGRRPGFHLNDNDRRPIGREADKIRLADTDMHVSPQHTKAASPEVARRDTLAPAPHA